MSDVNPPASGSSDPTDDVDAHLRPARSVAVAGDQGVSTDAEASTADDTVDEQRYLSADAPTTQEPTAPTQPAYPPTRSTGAPYEPVAAAKGDAPAARGNRFFGTAMVLLAAGIFEALFLGVYLGLVLIIAGAASVSQAFEGLGPLRWIPVLIFFVLFELVVLLFNRAGRFAYVLTSLIVGVLVWLGSIAFALILLRGSIESTQVFEQALLSPQFVIAGFVAREVMLWTGIGIGARGKRLRDRHRDALAEYRSAPANGDS